MQRFGRGRRAPSGTKHTQWRRYATILLSVSPSGYMGTILVYAWRESCCACCVGSAAVMNYTLDSRFGLHARTVRHGGTRENVERHLRGVGVEPSLVVTESASRRRSHRQKIRTRPLSRPSTESPHAVEQERLPRHMVGYAGGLEMPDRESQFTGVVWSG